MRPDWDETWVAVACVVARRSVCDRAQVGAVIVDATNRVVATAYNGPPAGWRPPTQSDELPRDYFESCSHWCVRAMVGPTISSRISYSDCPSIHAELNCLGFCDRRHREGGTIYVTGDICLTCAKAIANSGLARVVVARDVEDRSYRDADASYRLLRDSRLQVNLR